MTRNAGKRTWYKVYPMKCLLGSIRWQLDSAERGVWYDLLNLTAISDFPGFICDADQRPVPHEAIACQLQVPLELLKRTLQKCQQEGRIKENSNGIRIIHWEDYQGEYDRQKPSREKKAQEMKDETQGR